MTTKTYPDTPAYRSWFYMQDRFRRQICARWKDFEAFLSDMGERPPECSLNRIDKTKQFGPGNCQWLSYAREAGNRYEDSWEKRYSSNSLSVGWRAKVALAKARAEHRCQLCNSPDNLLGHHRTYQRLGNERVEDITILCPSCHTTFHARGHIADHVLGESNCVQAYLPGISDGDETVVPKKIRDKATRR